MTVKVPSGMTEADLARPVVVVNDFETEKLEYELYSYGEETVVIPVTIDKETPATKLASRQIEAEFKNYSRQAKVEMLSAHKCIVYVPERDISKIIGRQGKNIEKIKSRPQVRGSYTATITFPGSTICHSRTVITVIT